MKEILLTVCLSKHEVPSETISATLEVFRVPPETISNRKRPNENAISFSPELRGEIKSRWTLFLVNFNIFHFPQFSHRHS